MLTHISQILDRHAILRNGSADAAEMNEDLNRLREALNTNITFSVRVAGPLSNVVRRQTLWRQLGRVAELKAAEGLIVTCANIDSEFVLVLLMQRTTKSRTDLCDPRTGATPPATASPYPLASMHSPEDRATQHLLDDASLYMVNRGDGLLQKVLEDTVDQGTVQSSAYGHQIEQILGAYGNKQQPSRLPETR